jgi:hypothetical protein
VRPTYNTHAGSGSLLRCAVVIRIVKVIDDLQHTAWKQVPIGRSAIRVKPVMKFIDELKLRHAGSFLSIVHSATLAVLLSRRSPFVIEQLSFSLLNFDFLMLASTLMS